MNNVCSSLRGPLHKHLMNLEENPYYNFYLFVSMNEKGLMSFYCSLIYFETPFSSQHRNHLIKDIISTPHCKSWNFP